MIASRIRRVASNLAQKVNEQNLTEKNVRKIIDDLINISFDVDKFEDVVLLKEQYNVPANVIKIAFALDKKGVTAGMPTNNNDDGDDVA